MAKLLPAGRSYLVGMMARMGLKAAKSETLREDRLQQWFRSWHKTLAGDNTRTSRASLAPMLGLELFVNLEQHD